MNITLGSPLKKFFSLLAVCVAAVACGDQGQEKPLQVLTSPDNPPFEFKDTASGGDKVLGFDMDLAEKIGEKLGRPVQIVEIDFGGLIPALQAGRGDMVLAGVSATDERRKSVDFSDPYHEFKFALLVKEDSTIHSEKDLAQKKLGAQLGSSNELMAQTLAEETQGLTVESLNRLGELVQELKNGRVDAVLTEENVARSMAANSEGLKVVILAIKGDSPAVVFPKGSPLVDDVNKALISLEEEGFLAELNKKWFKE